MSCGDKLQLSTCAILQMIPPWPLANPANPDVSVCSRGS